MAYNEPEESVRGPLRETVDKAIEDAADQGVSSESIRDVINEELKEFEIE
jgi:hypothetical protein